MADNSKKSANHQQGDPNTTGHSWDGIEEFDNPMPRWWVWIFILCVIWSVGYWVVYPAWPGMNTATSGVLGYASRSDVVEEIAAFEERHDVLFAQILETEPGELQNDEDLHRFAVNAGASVFAAQCSQCHGPAAPGSRQGGFPTCWMTTGCGAASTRTSCKP